MEQLIIQTHPEAQYIFDNETLTITLFNSDHSEQSPVDAACRLAIEFFRFIQYVNHLTQWNLTFLIGIDSNQTHLFSYDYIRWLREEYLMKDRIYISAKIYEILRENSFYQFSPCGNNSIYFLFHETMYQTFTNLSISLTTSDMIDQLTRIQAEYHVEKHLGTITLTRSLRKRSLFELTSRYLHWFTLNFKEDFLTKDFQSIHRSNRPHTFLYLFIVFILIASLSQAKILNHLTFSYLLFLPLLIIALISLILLFHYYIRNDQADVNRKFYVYLNLLICLTLTILIFVAIQYHSIQNFKYLLLSNHTTTTNASSHRFVLITQKSVKESDLRVGSEFQLVTTR